MNLTASGAVLFLHIFLVITGLSFAAVLHTALLQLRASHDVAATRAWPRVIEVLEPTMPVVALLILLIGAWLIGLSAGEFAWSQGWVVASLVALVVAEVAGGLLAPRSSALRRAIRESPDGPVTEAFRRRIEDPLFWCVMHGATAIFLAVVFVMVVKPSGLWSTVVIAVVAVLGALSGLPFSRPRSQPPVPTQRRVHDVPGRRSRGRKQPTS